MSTVIPTVATVIGSTVSSAVYNGIVAAGDAGAAVTSKGISLLGLGLGYGADLLGRNHIATSLRAAADVGATVVSPTIRTGSKTVAFGASIVAGTVAGLASAAVAHGSIKLYEMAKGAYYTYKEPVGRAISDAAAVAADAASRQMLGTDDPEVLEVAYDDVVELKKTI